MKKMKRPIKFRGKSNGEWIYGALCDKYENEPESIYIIDDGCCYHKVDPESVEQFIGMVDMHGREIYEGDTIFWDNMHGAVTGKIEWEPQAAAFWLKWNAYGQTRYKEMQATFGDGKIYRLDCFEVLIDGKKDLFSTP